MRRLLAFCLLCVLAVAACTSADGSGASRKANQSERTARAVAKPAPRIKQTSPVVASVGEASAFYEGKRMRVRLIVTPYLVGRGDAPKAVLVNAGDAVLGYGFAFQLERKTKEGWRWINARQGFPLALLYLAPRERSEPQSLAVYFDEPAPVHLRAGRYRVTKGVDLAPGRPRPPTMTVTAHFQVKRR